MRPRLLLIVALALGPLALASIGQAVMRFQTRHEEIDSRLLQTAMYATGNERGIIDSGEMFLRELARRPEIRAAGPDCSQTLSNTLIGRPLYLNIMRVGADGKIMCGASSALLVNDYKRFSWWPEVRKNPGVTLGPSYYSPLARQTVLPMTLPIRGADGAFAGALSASVDMAWLNRRMGFGGLSPDALMMIVSRQGMVLGSNRVPSKKLAVEVAKRGWSHPDGIFAMPFNGRTWEWAAQPVARGDMIIAFGAPEPGLFDMSRVYFLADVLLPLLMIALASVAIWLGTEWLVIRWTKYLERVSAAYGQNHFALELNELDEAPEEFRQLGYEMKNMAVSIRDRDHSLKRAVEQKTGMAREIHHRVKNNLQIVSSLIGLYSQRVNDPQSRIAFRQIAVRVDALTLVHRLMERDDSVPIVDMKVLFTQMAEQMRNTATEHGRRYRLVVDAEARLLPAASATPIALFAAEVLSFGLFKRGETIAPRDVKLSFGADGPAHLLLAIEDDSFTEDDLRVGMPSPQRFLRAFSDQLLGRYWLETHGDGGSVVFLRIPAHAATEGARPDFDDCADTPVVFKFRAPTIADTMAEDAERSERG